MRNLERPESVDWEKVASLGYKRATRLRALEHVLVQHPNGIDPESLCAFIGLTGSAKIRTLQNDLNELRELYRGKQAVSHAPYRLVLGGDDLAFPEAEFNTNDRKQLNALCRLIAFFDGAVPVRDFLKVTMKDVDMALNEMSENIDIPASSKDLKYIKEIFDSIENKHPVDISYPRLNGGRSFAFSPYMLKRFNNRWFVIGRMAVENPFDWTLIPLSAIEMLAIHKGDCKYLPNKDSQLKDLKKRIRLYYSRVLGYHVPSPHVEPNELPRELNPETLDVQSIILRASDSILRFINENPIHPSQEIINETREIHLHLVINPLLKQRILSYGGEIEVISPLKLRNEIVMEAKKILTAYRAN